MAAIIREPVPKLEDTAPWIDAGLAAVVARALEKDPDRRFPTMNAFAEALEPFASAPESFDVASVRSVSNERRSVPRVSSRSGSQSAASISTAGGSWSRRHGSWLAPIAVVGVAAIVGIVMLATRAPAPKATASEPPTTATASASTIAVASSSSPSAAIAVASLNPVPPASVSASASVVTVSKPAAPPKPSSKKKPNDDPNVPNIF
jgi:serine/threonine-protein kinase